MERLKRQKLPTFEDCVEVMSTVNRTGIRRLDLTFAIRD